MAILEPENNNNNNRYIGKAHRNKVIASLPLEKQFNIRQLINNCDALSREDAIEMLKESLVQAAHKDIIYAKLMKG